MLHLLQSVAIGTYFIKITLNVTNVTLSCNINDIGNHVTFVTICDLWDLAGRPKGGHNWVPLEIGQYR